MTDEPHPEPAPEPAAEAPPPAEEAAAPKPSPRALAVRALAAFADWFWTNVTVGAFGVWLVGQVFRDSSKITSLCFLVPSVVVAAVLLATALLARLCTCRRIALAALVLSAGPAIATLCVENRWLPPRPRGDPAQRMRLVHWNVGASPAGVEATIAQLKACKPDACVLSELYSAEDAARILAALGPGYAHTQRHHMALIARGRTRFVLPDARIARRAYFVEWESPAGVLTVLLVDAPSTYHHARLLGEIRKRIDAHRPDLTAGDLNASRRSRALARLPEGYAHAYEAVGAGWSATWHDRYPLWDIDQCILGPRIRPIRYRLKSTGVSDHRMGVLDFSVGEAAP